MKKHLLLISVIFFVINTAYAQDGASLVSQLDGAVKDLSQNIHRKLIEGKAQKVSLGTFTYRGSVTSFSNYWKNQIIGELTNMQGRSYTVLAEGIQGADRTISGEIVLVTNIVRVYTRLIRSDDRSIETVLQSDFEQNAALNTMLVSGSSSGEGSSSGFPDEYEPDSWDNPVSCEIGLDENTQTMSRNFHEGGDEDFFLIIPDRNGRLTMETTGNIDTYMHFYNYDTRDELDTNDDGGSGSNARIRYNVQAGTRYLAKVRGYSRSTTGSYGFRAYMAAPREGSNSWDRPLSYELGMDDTATVMNRNLEESGDEDYILIVPDRNGRMTIETTGRLDTYMYLYDYDANELLEEDDDGGTSYNARIRYNVQTGKRYLVKIRELDEGTGSYGFRAWISR
jgi:hypothetical protein